MKDPNKYRAGLIEIKRRIKVIDHIGQGKLHVLYPATSVETAALQFRKVVELIAFSSLIANKNIYSEIHTKFSKHWNAKLILQDLERIHPDFYPQPIHQMPTDKPGIQSEFVPRNNDYLTKEQLIELYDECGGLLHAENPLENKQTTTHLPLKQRTGEVES